MDDNFKSMIKENTEKIEDEICHVISEEGHCPVQRMSCSNCLKYAIQTLLEFI